MKTSLILGLSFSHVITKAKSTERPLETGGGILADEMGMGKSLSVLALITKTLDSADAWQQGGDDTLADLIADSLSTLTPSRATLVLVPSARKCLGVSKSLEVCLLTHFIVLLDEWQKEIKKYVSRDGD
jgi:SNF2 family DNA or RNA helicase